MSLSDEREHCIADEIELHGCAAAAPAGCCRWSCCHQPLLPFLLLLVNIISPCSPALAPASSRWRAAPPSRRAPRRLHPARCRSLRPGAHPPALPCWWHLQAQSQAQPPPHGTSCPAPGPATARFPCRALGGTSPPTVQQQHTLVELSQGGAVAHAHKSDACMGASSQRAGRSGKQRRLGMHRAQPSCVLCHLHTDLA